MSECSLPLAFQVIWYVVSQTLLGCFVAVPATAYVYMPAYMHIPGSLFGRRRGHRAVRLVLSYLPYYWKKAASLSRSALPRLDHGLTTSHVYT